MSSCLYSMMLFSDLELDLVDLDHIWAGKAYFEMNIIKITRIPLKLYRALVVRTFTKCFPVSFSQCRAVSARTQLETSDGFFFFFIGGQLGFQFSRFMWDIDVWVENLVYIVTRFLTKLRFWLCWGVLVVTF